MWVASHCIFELFSLCQGQKFGLRARFCEHRGLSMMMIHEERRIRASLLRDAPLIDAAVSLFTNDLAVPHDS